MNIAQDLQTIALQEKTLIFPQFDSDRAWQLGSQLREMAVARGAVVAIEVRTFGAAAVLRRARWHDARQRPLGATQGAHGRAFSREFLRDRPGAAASRRHTRR